MNTTHPKRRDDVLIQESGDETMLYDPNVDELHILNATAQVIWELCDGEHSVEQISDEVSTRFMLTEDVNVQADVEQTLGAFGKKSLLQA